MSKANKWTAENFAVHLQESPEVYEKFVEFSLVATKHRKYFSPWTVCHRIRWSTMVGDNNSQFKVNNNWISFYSRKFMQDYPEHDGFFATRSRNTATESVGA